MGVREHWHWCSVLHRDSFPDSSNQRGGLSPEQAGRLHHAVKLPNRTGNGELALKVFRLVLRALGNNVDNAGWPPPYNI